MTETLDMTTENPPEAIEAGHHDLPLFLDAHEAIEFSRCEGVVDRGLAAFLDVGQALWQIRQSRLYRESYDTFEQYVDHRWHMSKSQAYRVISATEIVHQLEEAGSPIGDSGEHLLPANEAQARPLSQLPEHQRAGAWQASVERAGGQPTAQVVQEVVTGMLPPRPEKADAVAAPLFDIEAVQETQSRFACPEPVLPLTGEGDITPAPSSGRVRDADMMDEEWETSISRPASAADALSKLNAERDAIVKKWSEDETSSDAGAEAGEAQGDGSPAAAPEPVHAPDVAAPVAPKPAVAAPTTKPVKPVHLDAPHTSLRWGDAERQDFEANLPALNVVRKMLASESKNGVDMAEPNTPYAKALAVITLALLDITDACVMQDALAALDIFLSPVMTTYIEKSLLFGNMDVDDYVSAAKELSALPASTLLRLSVECLLRLDVDTLAYEQEPNSLRFLTPAGTPPLCSHRLYAVGDAVEVLYGSDAWYPGSVIGYGQRDKDLFEVQLKAAPRPTFHHQNDLRRPTARDSAAE